MVVGLLVALLVVLLLLVDPDACSLDGRDCCRVVLVTAAVVPVPDPGPDDQRSVVERVMRLPRNRATSASSLDSRYPDVVVRVEEVPVHRAVVLGRKPHYVVVTLVVDHRIEVRRCYYHYRHHHRAWPTTTVARPASCCYYLGCPGSV
uniref:Putative secreted protein n=1 Tax=Anopheles darlingi TaxID=43151 RepID=A0A2M4D4R2_ANODA